MKAKRSKKIDATVDPTVKHSVNPVVEATVNKSVKTFVDKGPVEWSLLKKPLKLPLKLLL